MDILSELKLEPQMWRIEDVCQTYMQEVEQCLAEANIHSTNDGGLNVHACLGLDD